MRPRLASRRRTSPKSWSITASRMPICKPWPAWKRWLLPSTWSLLLRDLLFQKMVGEKSAVPGDYMVQPDLEKQAKWLPMDWRCGGINLFLIPYRNCGRIQSIWFGKPKMCWRSPKSKISPLATGNPLGSGENFWRCTSKGYRLIAKKIPDKSYPRNTMGVAIKHTM